MDSRVVQEHGPSLSRVEPGIVVFGHSMQLKYANEQARLLLNRCDDDRVTALQKHDLRIEIVKLGARVREQDSTVWEDQFPRLLGTQKTVRTTQGSFRLRAFGMSDHSCGSPHQIMIVIEDRQTKSPTRYRRGGINPE
jgi:hypothetical protein